VCIEKVLAERYGVMNLITYAKLLDCSRRRLSMATIADTLRHRVVNTGSVKMAIVDPMQAERVAGDPISAGEWRAGLAPQIKTVSGQFIFNVHGTGCSEFAD
jgi:hypothetical protein